MIRKISKRFAWVMVLCMILTLAPSTAFASDLPAPSNLRLGSNQIGNTTYYGHSDTKLFVQWDEVEEMEPYYDYRVSKDIKVEGQEGIIEGFGESQGSGVGPLDSLCQWTELNGQATDYSIVKVTAAFVDDQNNPGPAAELNTDIEIRHVEESQKLTANYIGTTTFAEPGYSSYDEATFQINGVLGNSSADFTFVNDSGSGIGISASSSLTGVVEIRDRCLIRNGQTVWQMSLGDLEIGEDEKYYLDVYDTDYISTTTAAVTITRYPVDIVFDSFEITVDGALTYTGNQITPNITVQTMEETPQPLTIGDDYTLSFEKAGNSINPEDIQNAGTYTAVIEGETGTPYEGKTARKSFTVSKAMPDYGSAPTGLVATYGQTLAEVSLPNGFSFEDSATTTVGNAGQNSFNVKFTPADTQNYNEVTGIQVTIDVAKANQSVPTLSLSSSVCALGLTPPSLTASGGNGTGAYSFASTTPAAATVDTSTVDASTGVIQIVSKGTTSFKVSKAADDNYNESAVSEGVSLKVVDKVSVSARDTAATEAALVSHLKNQGQITVGNPMRVGPSNEFTIAVNGKTPLATYASSDSQQGEAKWIGVLIGDFSVNDGSSYDMTDLYYKTTENGNYNQLTSTDKTEAIQVGGTDKDLILWVKSDVDPQKSIWLATSSSGENEAKLTIHFTPYTAPSNSGGGRSSSSSTAPKIASGQGTTTVTTTLQATSNAAGTATAKVSTDTVNGLIKKAKEAENEKKSAIIEISVKTQASATSTEIQIPKSSFDSIVKDTNAEMKISTGIGTITFDEGALAAINKNADGNINIHMSSLKNENFSDDVKKIVGDRPVYDFTVTAGDKKISSFNGGTASISVPYTLKSGEDKNAIVVYYLSDDGELQTVKGNYNEKLGMVEFAVEHFSYYVIGYNEALTWDNPFKDVKQGAWYYENVYYAYKNGLMSGTSATSFNPDEKTNRAMVATLLWRLEGSQQATTNTFSDVGDTWYTNAVSWGASKGIVNGYGNDKFKPLDTITREQLATIIYNYAKYKGYSVADTTDLTIYTDADSVSVWAKDAMTFVVAKGILTGKGNNHLDPKATATRAEVAAIIQRANETLTK